MRETSDPMGGPRVVTRHLADGVAELVMNGPRGNAINPVLVDALATALDEIEAEPPTALLITSAQDAFMVGGDVRLLARWADAGVLVDRWGAMAQAFGTVTDRVASLASVTIAVLHGAVVGGGLELAVAADMRVAHTATAMGLPEAQLGVYPSAGGVPRLAGLVGRSRALDMILTGRLCTPEEAHRIGLVDQVVDTPGDVARQLASRIARVPAGAVEAVKADLPTCSRPSQSSGRLADLLREVPAERLLQQLKG